jgi:uncharacterized iron-regulated membrane protein
VRPRQCDSLGAVTAAALAMIVLSAVLAWRQRGFGTYEQPHDDPAPHDRRRFQGFATLLLSGLEADDIEDLAAYFSFVK